MGFLSFLLSTPASARKSISHLLTVPYTLDKGFGIPPEYWSAVEGKKFATSWKLN
jgi:hypothetical protein